MHEGNNWSSAGVDTEPVTLAEAKEHLRILHTDEDDYITALISAARDWCERYIDLAIPQQTVTLRLDAFPDDRSAIQLPFANLLSVTSVAYLDSDGDSQTVATSVYGENLTAKPAEIYLKANQVWPSDEAQQDQAVTIVYEAGFAEVVSGVQDCPKAVKQAILLIIGHFYENREDAVMGVTITEIPMGAKACLDRYRLYGV